MPANYTTQQASFRYGLVYVVTNLINGKRYIGKTVLTLTRRWSAHRGHAERKANAMILHASIRKYGHENFEIKQLCRARDYLLPQLEMFFIKAMGTRIESGYGYNMTDGGEGMIGHYPSAETRAKMSAALMGNQRQKGRRITPEFRARISEIHLGRKKTAAMIQAMVERESERFQRVCRRGHLRTPENTKKYAKRDGRIQTDCMDCRRASPSRTREGSNK